MITPITFQTKLVNEDGTPTQAFLNIWQELVNMRLTDISDVSVTSPANGDVLTWSSILNKWIAI